MKDVFIAVLWLFTTLICAVNMVSMIDYVIAGKQLMATFNGFLALLVLPVIFRLYGELK